MGNTPWNKGIPVTEEMKVRISRALKGRKLSEETKRKMAISRTKGKSRLSWAFKKWREGVFERDNFTCQKCESRDCEKLHPHHVVPWKMCEEKRFDVANGITLCRSCHAKLEGFQKGHKAWATGRKFTEEHRRNISNSHKGIKYKNRGKSS